MLQKVTKNYGKQICRSLHAISRTQQEWNKIIVTYVICKYDQLLILKSIVLSNGFYWLGCEKYRLLINIFQREILILKI